MNVRNTLKNTPELPKLILPYTESEDQLEPSLYFKHRVEEIHKIESNASSLFQINEDLMMNTKRSSEGKNLMDIKGIKHLESAGDNNYNFISIPRMTSL